MRYLLAWLDLANVLYVVGAACIAATVYALAPVWTPAFVGLVFIVAGVGHDLSRKGGTNGPAR